MLPLAPQVCSPNPSLPPVPLGAFHPASMMVCLKTSPWWGRPENLACNPAGGRSLGPANGSATPPPAALWE